MGGFTKNNFLGSVMMVPKKVEICLCLNHMYTKWYTSVDHKRGLNGSQFIFSFIETQKFLLLSASTITKKKFFESSYLTKTPKIEK